MTSCIDSIIAKFKHLGAMAAGRIATTPGVRSQVPRDQPLDYVVGSCTVGKSGLRAEPRVVPDAFQQLPTYTTRKRFVEKQYHKLADQPPRRLFWTCRDPQIQNRFSYVEQSATE